MQAGLIARYDALELRLVSEWTRTSTYWDYEAVSQLVCRHTPTPTTTAQPITLHIERAGLYVPPGSPVESAYAEVWYLGNLIYSETLAPASSYTLHLRLDDFTVHVLLDNNGDPIWRVAWTGGLLTTPTGTQAVSGAVLLSQGSYFAPSSLPILGIPPTLQSDLTPQLGTHFPPGTYDLRTKGGWRFKQGATAIAFPVSVNVQGAYPSQPACHLSALTPPIISAPDTYTGELQAIVVNSAPEFPFAAACPIPETRRRGLSLCLLPDLPREWTSLISPEPTACMVERAAFPQTWHTRQSQGQNDLYDVSGGFCTSTSPDFNCPQYNQSDTVTQHASQPAQVRLTNNAEPTLTSSVIAPYSYALRQSTREVISSSQYRGRFRTDSVSFPSVASDSHALSHDTPLARYVNSWAHPFWRYWLYFANWSLGVPLTPAPADHYWRPLQQQWLGEPALPLAERTKQRTLCALEPLTVSPYVDWMEGYAGYKTLWAGACRFDAITLANVTQKQLTSSSQSRWSFTNATAVFGASILVTPIQATSTLEFDLTDWQVEPYLYPALATAVRVQITGVYNSVRVYLVNFEGDAHELQPDPNDATKYLYTPAADSVYAGDWAQSYAAQLTGYSETGVDLKPEGRSSSVMADPARRTLWELLHSQTPANLRIVVEQPAPTPYTLAYPTFYREFSDPNNCKAYPLTAHTQAVVDHDALWRYGGLNFQLTTPVPQLRLVHQSPTVYDALCLRNLLYRGESYQHQMTADAYAYYDSVEWTGAFADLRMDTRSLILPLRARNHPAVWLLINAYREVPPLACLPRKKRDANLAETGDWGQWQYLISPLHRYYVGLDNPVHLHRVEYDANGNETGRQVVTSYLEAFRRAHSTYHELALDNDEVITQWNNQSLNSPRYLIHSKGDDWARVTPFHGYSAVVWISEQAGAWLALTRSTALRTVRAYVEDSSVHVGYARDPLLQDWTDYDTTLDAIQPALCYLPAARQLALAVQMAGEVRIYTQANEGGGFSMATTVANGAHPTLIATNDGRIFCYYYRQGVLYGRQYDALWQAVGGEFTAISPADDAEIDAIETVTAQGKSLIAVIYRDGGVIKVKTSLDGRQFS